MKSGALLIIPRIARAMVPHYFKIAVKEQGVHGWHPTGAIAAGLAELV